MNHLTLIEDVVAAVKFQGFNATLIKGTTTSSLFMIDRANPVSYTHLTLPTSDLV